MGVRGQTRTVVVCKICNNSSHSVQHLVLWYSSSILDTPTGQLLHHAISSKFRTEIHFFWCHLDMPLSWTVDRFYISPLDPLLFNLSRIVVALPLPQSVSNFESLLLGILRQSRCLTSHLRFWYASTRSPGVYFKKKINCLSSFLILESRFLLLYTRIRIHLRLIKNRGNDASISLFIFPLWRDFILR